MYYVCLTLSAVKNAGSRLISRRNGKGLVRAGVETMNVKILQTVILLILFLLLLSLLLLRLTSRVRVALVVVVIVFGTLNARSVTPNRVRDTLQGMVEGAKRAPGDERFDVSIDFRPPVVRIGARAFPQSLPGPEPGNRRG
uniref:Uncharacterized protein n=1 Tax=Sipha flava TaxID=143950 RepID=A0A2S2Q9U4_9HEMI